MRKWTLTLTLVLNLFVAAGLKAQEIGLILLGDTGEINQDRDRVAKAIKTYCQVEICTVVLLLGDNFYNTGVTSVDDPQFKTKFEDPYKELKLRFFPVLGNHDALGNWQAEIDYTSERWNLIARYYKLDLKLVNLYALDTNLYVLNKNIVSNPAVRKQQNIWLKNQLTDSTAEWKIVYGHHPVFSSGMHSDTKALIEDIKPLLQKYQVDFYISGHDHDKELIEQNGTKYIISGTGSKSRPITKSEKSQFAASTYGFAHLLFKNNTAILRFVDENGKIEFQREYKK